MIIVPAGEIIVSELLVFDNNVGIVGIRYNAMSYTTIYNLSVNKEVYNTV